MRTFVCCFFLWASAQHPQCSIEAAALELTATANTSGCVGCVNMIASLLARAAACGIQGAMQHAQDQNDQNDQNRRRCGAKSKAHHGCHHVTRFKNKINQAKEAFTSVIQLANQTTCQSVSTKAFGYGLKQSKDTYNTVSQQGLHAMTIDKTNQTQSYILKGLTSHCKAVRNALHRFLNDTNYICHSEIGDEASMWCRRALTAKEKEIAKKAAAKQKAAGKKGACNIDRMVYQENQSAMFELGATCET